MFDNFEWYKFIGDQPTAWQGHILWAYSEIPKINPSVIVELGVHWGHSFFTMAESCIDHGIKAKLYGIDHWLGDIHAGSFVEEKDIKGRWLEDENAGGFGEDDSPVSGVYEVAQKCSKLYPNVKLIKDTFSNAVLSWTKDIDLLHIDGRHLYEDVKEDFENWEPFVKDGGTIWLHDTQVRDRGFGVQKYFKELKQQHPEWKFEERFESKGLGIIRK